METGCGRAHREITFLGARVGHCGVVSYSQDRAKSTRFARSDAVVTSETRGAPRIDRYYEGCVAVGAGCLELAEKRR